eukprot:CAMPEP_0174832370 /NCGR_PEP_ID=MMETSP1114-20130205/3639_1 /TAXON_ID=312471 /ORGANISM="Neobodo designis, Strain CCAP 1951/1" /LENGTH=761 /DNA_ID=CAMNT_0016066229 /DNA_START=87 /DNA_END=2372 /DNA_ORIENTATION=-
MGRRRFHVDAMMRFVAAAALLILLGAEIGRRNRSRPPNAVTEMAPLFPAVRSRHVVSASQHGAADRELRSAVNGFRHRRMYANDADEGSLDDGNVTEVPWESNANGTNTTVAPAANGTNATNTTVAPTNWTWPGTTFTPNTSVAPTTNAPAPTNSTGNDTAVIDITCSVSGNEWVFAPPYLEPPPSATFPGFVIDLATHNTAAKIQSLVDGVCAKYLGGLTPAPNVTNVTLPPVGPPPPANNHTSNVTNGTNVTLPPSSLLVNWTVLCREGIVNFTNGTASTPLWVWNHTQNQTEDRAGSNVSNSSHVVPGTNVTWDSLPWWGRFLEWNNSFPVPLTIGVNASRWETPLELQRLIDFVCDGGPATRNPGTIAPTLPPEPEPTTGAPPATMLPNRSAVLPWFSISAVLGRTPIFTVGTFIADNSLINAAGFSRALSEELRGQGLWQFTDADATEVVQVTHCGVLRASEFGSSPFSPGMCRSDKPCTERRPCLDGVRSCVCPTVQWYLPLNDSYVDEASSDEFAEDASAMAGDGNWTIAEPNFTGATRKRQVRRQVSPLFVQMQFPLRLEFAEAFFPETPQDIVNVLTSALNATMDTLHRDDFAAAWSIDRSFIFVRFAFDDLRSPVLPTLPGTESKPQLLWLLVLLVFPVAALAYGIFRLVQYLRWKHYGSKLQLHLDEYDKDFDGDDPNAAAAAKTAMDAVARGMGDGAWAEGDAGRKDPDEFFAVADAAALEEFDLFDAAPTDGDASTGGEQEDSVHIEV